MRVRNRVGAGRISRLEFEAQALQFLSKDFLSPLPFCLFLAQPDRLTPVDADNVFVGHCCSSPPTL
jgi:hypothetical protein